MRIHDCRFVELDARTFHDIVKLRVDIFVVEQACPYPELDGLDTRGDTRHVWLQGEDGGVASYVRLLAEDAGTRIGRVVTRVDHRGQGLSGRLLTHALERSAGPWVLHAQAHLADWYGRYGFVTLGEPFLEDGIPHVLMRREA